MQIQDSDILVSGGGIAGLITAAAFGSAGYSVTCVDPTPRSPRKARRARTCAPPPSCIPRSRFWRPRAVGTPCPHATALQIMRIIDAGGNFRRRG